MSEVKEELVPSNGISITEDKSKILELLNHGTGNLNYTVGILGASILSSKVYIVYRVGLVNGLAIFVNHRIAVLVLCLNVNGIALFVKNRIAVCVFLNNVILINLNVSGKVIKIKLLNSGNAEVTCACVTCFDVSVHRVAAEEGNKTAEGSVNIVISTVKVNSSKALIIYAVFGNVAISAGKPGLIDRSLGVVVCKTTCNCRLTGDVKVSTIVSILRAKESLHRLDVGVSVDSYTVLPLSVLIKLNLEYITGVNLGEVILG